MKIARKGGDGPGLYPLGQAMRVGDEGSQQRTFAEFQNGGTSRRSMDRTYMLDHNARCQLMQARGSAGRACHHGNHGHRRENGIGPDRLSQEHHVIPHICTC